MSVADVVRRAERKINAFNTKRSLEAGWQPTVVPYIGYGDETKVRVLARVLMSNPDREPRTAAVRGFRQFFTIQVGDHQVSVRAGAASVTATTDRGGYVEVLLHDHGLEPGWQEVTITAAGAEPAQADVFIMEPGTDFGIVSDIDDTVIVTMLPRAMIAAYNSWFLRTDKRKAVPGFSEFYAEVQRRHPKAPVFYLSTGAWNTFGTLRRFLKRNGLPLGPLLLTDWGPTQTGLFRSGQEHKQVQLRNLFIDFPQLRWLLVGDDGQHDPLIYGTAAVEHPDRIAGIAIRNLSPQEHVLSHGTAGPLDRLELTHVPLIEGADGHRLLEQIDQLD